VRRATNVLKGVLWPLRDAFAALIRTEVPHVAPETKIFLNDTLDHTMRLIELVETQRDTVTGLMEMHLSLSQARTNDIIGYLTIVSVIFMPLTFLVGVWGMNFDPDTSPWNMPELRAYYGYPSALLFMAVVAAGLIGFFKWKKWL
jgi:magnesium transporter